MSELISINKPSAPTTSTKLIVTLMTIAAISGLLIAIAVQATAQLIAVNRQEGLRQSVLQVVPRAGSIKIFAPDGKGGLREAAADEKVDKIYAGYSSDGKLQGVAFEGVGQGYADKVKLLFGYNPYDQTIVGMKVLESKETPGLGDKISGERFQENFKQLEAAPAPGGQGLARQVEVVKAGEKSKPWQIDAITGATISSKAVGKIVNQDAGRFVPLIVQNLRMLETEGADGGK